MQRRSNEKAYAKGGKVAMYNVGGMVKSSGPMSTGIAKPKNLINKEQYNGR